MLVFFCGGDCAAEGYVVGKEDVGDFVVGNVLFHVFGEIAEIYHVDFFKRVEEARGDCVAVTVFENEHAATVAC